MPATLLIIFIYYVVLRGGGTAQELRAHAITLGGTDLVEHELMLVVHQVLGGALDVAEQLE